MTGHNTINGDYSSANLAAVFGRRTLERMIQGLDVSFAARLAATFAARALDEEPKVIGYISPTEPWGIANCDRCDGYLLPDHHCPGGAA